MNDSRGIEFRERAFRFTCDIFDFCEELAAQPGMRRRVAYQLFDAVSSIGANLEEAKAAHENSRQLAEEARRGRERNWGGTIAARGDEWVAMPRRV